jgi:2,3-dihydroxybenzoate-AMP ligase
MPLNSEDAPPWPPEFASLYREKGYWIGETLWDLLATHAGDDHRVALVDGERRWTYAELADRASRVAAGFHAAGISRDDRVVVHLPNIAEFFVTIFALFRLGALPVLALPAHRFAEIHYYCEHTEAVAYVVEDFRDGFDGNALAEQLTAALPALRVVVVGSTDRFQLFDSLYHDPYTGDGPDASDTAFLELSGGSTGTPKLIPRTHDDYYYSIRESARICGLTQDSIYLLALPAAHNFPLSSPGTLGTLHAGGRVVLAPKPAPDIVFPLIERERATITAAVPPLALAWLAAAASTPHDLSSLDVLQVGGAKFGPEAARRVAPELGCRLQQVFGMAEGLVNYTRLDDPDELVVGTQGRPISPDDEIRIVDEEDNDLPVGATGRLLTRGPYTIRGYYRAAEHNRAVFTAAGFYRTGDLVRLTPEGYLVVEDRVKDQINRGGEKVAGAEVENHLLAHEAVYDAAVVSMPDDYLGERTCAFLIRHEEHPNTEINLATMRTFLRTRGLAEYKLPDRVEVVREFPKTGPGKVHKKELRKAISDMIAARRSGRKDDR